VSEAFCLVTAPPEAEFDGPNDKVLLERHAAPLRRYFASAGRLFVSVSGFVVRDLLDG
jgi:hypothetical protein